jgi:hypothetical protein
MEKLGYFNFWGTPFGNYCYRVWIIYCPLLTYVTISYWKNIVLRSCEMYRPNQKGMQQDLCGEKPNLKQGDI